MDLKQLMKLGVDVAELYSKLGEISDLSLEANKIDQEIIEKQSQIKKLLKNVPASADKSLRIDLMNGAVLVVEPDNMYMEVKGD